MQKMLAILGGTFDPVHNGHLALANEINMQLDLCELRFLPCYQSPLKSTTQASATQRLEMLKLALDTYPNFHIDDREIKRQGVSYMYDTLLSIRREINNIPLTLIMSADAFAKFNSWYKWQDIFSLAHLIIANRPNSQAITSTELQQQVNKRQLIDAKKLLQKPAGNIHFIKIPANKISATMIRDLITNNKDASEFVPTNVWDYIRKNGLYQKSEAR